LNVIPTLAWAEVQVPQQIGALQAQTI